QIAVSANADRTGRSSSAPDAIPQLLGLDGLTAIVSEQNRLSVISIDQLVQVVTGRLTNWSQLGYAPGQINVYIGDSKSTTFNLFKALVLDPSNENPTQNARRFASEIDLAQAVSSDKNAIGITSVSLKGSAKSLDISTTCNVSYSPTPFNIKADEYPLTRHVFLYTTSAPRAHHANGLINFGLTDQAQQIISQAGLINQSIEFLPFKKQGDRIVRSLDPSGDSFDLNLLRTLINEIGESSRMSVSFRFRPASFALDPASLENVKRLAALLSGEELRNADLLLIGFSDALGAFDRNRELSIVRARQVKQALLDAAGGRIDAARLQTRGYGELIPVGCNDDPQGRARNRRVEIWVRTNAVPVNAPQIAAPKPREETKRQQRTTRAPAGNAPAGNVNNDPLFREFLKWNRQQQQQPQSN
ncbi:MAG: phosphate ABC transporter substrate-binding/OmpA family protein, partial [Hyphomicrobiaceae bacterium]